MVHRTTAFAKNQRECQNLGDSRHWRRLVKNIGGSSQNIGGANQKYSNAKGGNNWWGHWAKCLGSLIPRSTPMIVSTLKVMYAEASKASVTVMKPCTANRSNVGEYGWLENHLTQEQSANETCSSTFYKSAVAAGGVLRIDQRIYRAAVAAATSSLSLQDNLIASNGRINEANDTMLMTVNDCDLAPDPGGLGWWWDFVMYGTVFRVDFSKSMSSSSSRFGCWCGRRVLTPNRGLSSTKPQTVMMFSNFPYLSKDLTVSDYAKRQLITDVM